MVGLTARARELLAYIDARELCPSQDEMRVALGLSSKSSVSQLIDQLEERGYVRRLRNRARAIEVIKRRDPPPELVKEPVLGASLPRLKYIPLAAGKINADDRTWWPPYGRGGA